MIIKNKVIFITGACGKIGSSIVNEFLKNENSVILMDINKKKLTEFSSHKDNNYLICHGNFIDKEDLDNSIKKSVEKFGKIDACIHAAYPKSNKWGKNFEEVTIDHLSEDLSNQIGGAIIFSQSFIKFFLNQGFGQIIHISSIQGVLSPKFDHYKNTNMNSPIEYSAIKSGIISIVKYLAKYYKKRNIRINCISPGGIFDDQPKLFLEKYKEVCNSKGMLEPTDLIGLLSFLISDSSKFINGQNIIIDDGWSL